MAKKSSKTKIPKLSGGKDFFAEAFGVKIRSDEADADVFAEFLRADPGLREAAATKDRIIDVKAGQKSPSATSKSADTPAIVIDVHGQTERSANEYIEQHIEAGIFSAKKQTQVFKIITGKGMHSQGKRGVLVDSTHAFVSRKFADRIVEIDPSPASISLGGLPLRGYFMVTIRKG